MSIETTGKARLEKLEEQAWNGFISAAEAMQTIQDERLWQHVAKNWAEYVATRWGKSRNWPSRKLIAVKIVNTCAQKGADIPQLNSPVLRTQSHVLAIRGAPPEERADILETVTAANPKPTAKQIKTEVDRRAAEREAREPEKPRPKRDHEPEITDKVRKALAMTPTFKALGLQITGIAKGIEQLAVGNAGAFLSRELQAVQAKLRDVQRALKFQAPYADCVVCEQSGKVGGKQCPTCKGCCWLPKLVFNACGDDKKKRSKVVKYSGGKDVVEEFLEEANDEN